MAAKYGLLGTLGAAAIAGVFALTVALVGKGGDEQQHAGSTDSPRTSVSSPSGGDSVPSKVLPTATEDKPSTPSGESGASDQQGSRPMRLVSPSCDKALVIDFDSDRLVKQVVVDDLPPDEAAKLDLIYSGCGAPTMRLGDDQAGGILAKGSPATEGACEAAAQGGGLEEIQWDTDALREQQIIAGAALCVITDEGRVAMAKVVKIGRNGAPDDFAVSSWP
ncbi:hypothetical protein [Streptomyces sp. NPDC060184]|uniref:hypothetical protein n=1 Tax=Streptomyces sp. NPDC060184 TaxID=3347064 RepID=UPI003661783C